MSVDLKNLSGHARINAAFAKAKQEERTAFVGFITAGWYTTADTVPALLALQDGGADVIELGVPFSDPLAEGPTIQKSSHKAIQQGVTMNTCFDFVKQARAAGLAVPIVFMGYVNNFLKYGYSNLAADSREAGVDGFICVDLPPEEAGDMLAACQKEELSFIPLITPTTTQERIPYLCSLATSFIYCVSVSGVTGARQQTSASLPDFVRSIRRHTDKYLAVGFGVSTHEHVVNVGKVADGAVVGSAIINAMEKGDTVEDRVATLKRFIQELTGRADGANPPKATMEAVEKAPAGAVPEAGKPVGAYGDFGGRYIPETLLAAHEALEKAYREAIKDPEFLEELASLRKHYVGGPTPLTFAERSTKHCGGARIWLKREDLCHTGAHKINNALGQALLAKRLGKSRIIAETGAGQHGVATATACALLGLDCTVYMGEEDCNRQALNVFKMKMMGSKVVPVKSGSRTLKDAINEAMRDWVTNVESTHYIIGSAVGPHPFPEIVREFQAVIGREARAQMLDRAGKLPDLVVACVGGGSNAIGIFHPFEEDKDVGLLGVEPGGEGLDSGKHGATLSCGVPGVLHGSRSFVIQDEGGQIVETHSISAGLDYPGVGPQHAFLKVSGRANYTAATDKEALAAMQLLSRLEGIIPALETSHAVHAAFEAARRMPADQDVLICVSGRGDKDMVLVKSVLEMEA